MSLTFRSRIFDRIGYIIETQSQFCRVFTITSDSTREFQHSDTILIEMSSDKYVRHVRCVPRFTDIEYSFRAMIFAFESLRTIVDNWIILDNQGSWFRETLHSRRNRGAGETRREPLWRELYCAESDLISIDINSPPYRQRVVVSI